MSALLLGAKGGREREQEREEEQEDKQQSIHSFTSQIQEEPTVEFSSGDGGLGNNILGLVSAYMIAALSNATFYCIIFLHSYSLHSTLSNYYWFSLWYYRYSW